MSKLTKFVTKTWEHIIVYGRNIQDSKHSASFSKDITLHGGQYLPPTDI